MTKTMYRYKVYVPGLKNTTFPAEHFLTLRDYLEENFEGWTVYETQGSWKDFRECIDVYEMLIDIEEFGSLLRIETFAKLAKELYNQKCVLWTQEEIKGEFE